MKPSSFRPDIEGMRGVAVLLVVLFHAGVPGFGGGYVGVDVFFVLSGYLITGILYAELESTGSLRLANFYARRVRRLLPASLLVSVVTLALAYLLASPLELDRWAKSATATSLYVANGWFAVRGANYFDQAVATDPFLHTWTLAVEEQFYLVWPLLMLLGARVFKRRLVWYLGAIAALSFAVSVWLTYERPVWAFYSSPTRAWEFAAGGIAALLPALTGRAWKALGVLAIGAASLLLSEMTPFPGVAALLPVVGTLLVVASRPVDGWLAHPALQRIGTLSYSWYLWHWPALIFAGILVPEWGIAGRLLAVVVSLGLARVAFALVETPVRFHPKLLRFPGRSLALGAGLTLAGATTAGLALLLARRLESTPAQQRYVQAASPAPTEVDACFVKAPRTELVPCEFGSGPTRVALFGDSHAAQWIPALRTIADRRGWTVSLYIKLGCPPQRVPVFYAARRSRYVECDTWRDRVYEQIAATKPDMVIVSAFQAHVSPDRTAMADPLGEWEAATRAMAEEFGRVVLIRDTPWVRVDPPTCLSRRAYRAFHPECSVPRSAGTDDRLFRAELAGLGSSGTAVDLTDAICEPSACPFERGGTVVYQDGDHISAEFSASLADQLEARITEPRGPSGPR